MTRSTGAFVLLATHLACGFGAMVVPIGELPVAVDALVLGCIPLIQLAAWAVWARRLVTTGGDGTALGALERGSRLLTSPGVWHMSFPGQVRLGLNAAVAGAIYIGVGRLLVDVWTRQWGVCVFSVVAGTVALPMLWALGRGEYAPPREPA